MAENRSAMTIDEIYKLWQSSDRYLWHKAFEETEFYLSEKYEFPIGCAALVECAVNKLCEAEYVEALYDFIELLIEVNEKFKYEQPPYKPQELWWKLSIISDPTYKRDCYQKILAIEPDNVIVRTLLAGTDPVLAACNLPKRMIIPALKAVVNTHYDDVRAWKALHTNTPVITEKLICLEVINSLTPFQGQSITGSSEETGNYVALHLKKLIENQKIQSTEEKVIAKRVIFSLCKGYPTTTQDLLLLYECEDTNESPWNYVQRMLGKTPKRKEDEHRIGDGNQTTCLKIFWCSHCYGFSDVLSEGLCRKCYEEWENGDGKFDGKRTIDTDEGDD